MTPRTLALPLLTAIALMVISAAGCTSEADPVETWTFSDARSGPPGDAGDHFADDSDEPPSDADPCPVRVQPRDGDCDPRCADVDPDCATNCPDPEAPDVEYASGTYQDPAKCRTIQYSCPEGWKSFDRRRCGCGCRATSATGVCDAMAAVGAGSCAATVGVKFDGSECTTLDGCRCRGSDCGKLFASMSACRRATGDCDRTCGDPEAATCDRYPDKEPSDCPEGSVLTVRNCKPVCLDPQTCEPPGPETCGPGDPCGPDAWCDYPDGMCGDGRSGTCKEKPPTCTDDYDPVCGCDGQTYHNPCRARRQAVDYRYKDPC